MKLKNSYGQEHFDMRLPKCTPSMIVTFMAISHNLLAASPHADEVVKIIVQYEQGDSIQLARSGGVNRANDDFVVSAVVNGKSFTFTEHQIQGRPAISSPVLYSRSSAPDSFSFDLDLDCSESNFPKHEKGWCKGNYLVSTISGKIISLNKYIQDGVNVTEVARLNFGE